MHSLAFSPLSGKTNGKFLNFEIVLFDLFTAMLAAVTSTKIISNRAVFSVKHVNKFDVNKGLKLNNSVKINRQEWRLEINKARVAALEG